MAKSTLFAVGIIVGILCFPGYLTILMVVAAFWILISLLRASPFWWIAGALAGLPFLKGMDGSISLGVLVVIFVAIGAVDLWPRFHRRKHGVRVVSGRPVRVAQAVLLAMVVVWFGTDRQLASTRSRPRPALDSERPIICLGDSLTSFGYPAELSKLAAVPIVDFGFDGYDTEDALELLPKIATRNPQAVVLEIGGHDFRKGNSRESTLANLQQLIDSFEEMGAVVIIVEIPRGFIHDPFFGIERKLARENDLELVSDTVIREFIFWSPILPPGTWVDASRHYSDDGLHPNPLGNKHFAKVVFRSLIRVFGDAVKK